MMGLSAEASIGCERSSFEVAFVDETGRRRRDALSSCWDAAFERAEPVRSFPATKASRSYSGYWWSVTTGRHVGYESWVERNVAMMLDFDREVAAFSSQPFWLHWQASDGRVHRHAPDYFVRLADGSGLVVDVRGDDQVDAVAAESFAATEQACAQVGWGFERTGGPGAVLAANVRWLAAHRHRRCHEPRIAEALLAVLSRPAPLMAAAEAVGDRLGVLPVLFHLMWRQVLTADLRRAVLSPHTVVGLGEGAG